VPGAISLLDACFISFQKRPEAFGLRFSLFSLLSAGIRLFYLKWLYCEIILVIRKGLYPLQDMFPWLEMELHRSISAVGILKFTIFQYKYFASLVTLHEHVCVCKIPCHFIYSSGVKYKKCWNKNKTLYEKVTRINHFYNTMILNPCWVGPLSPRHGASSDCGWREVHQLQRVAANIFNKQSQTADKGLSSSLGVGRGAKNPSP